MLIPDVYRDTYPTVEVLQRCLNENSIVYGIDQDILQRMVLKRVCNKRILVAEGRPPESGVDGRIELLIDISGIGKPKRLADGSVDHKELKKVINVSKGQKLVKRIPPKPGKNGCSIFGKKIEAPPPKDVVLATGGGTEISEDDPDLLVSASDGAVVISASGGIEVRTAKVITGDIDYSTGNISFSGDLKVMGTVRAGFVVNADGNLFIGGSVEDTEASCAGNMEIVGGAIGSGNGKLICGGGLKVHHLENFDVEVQKDITVNDTILHSTVKTTEHLKAKTIVGGNIEASHGFEVDTIGTAAESKTVIKVGSTYFLLQQQKLLLEKREELQNGLKTCKEEMYDCVKNGMDNDGKLNNDDTVKLEELKDNKNKILKQFGGLDNGLEEIELKLKDNPNPVIEAKQIFPNTIIRFGLLEKAVKERLNNITVCADENKIIFRRS